jgi:hypothetical protein
MVGFHTRFAHVITRCEVSEEGPPKPTNQPTTHQPRTPQPNSTATTTREDHPTPNHPHPLPTYKVLPHVICTSNQLYVAPQVELVSQSITAVARTERFCLCVKDQGKQTKTSIESLTELLVVRPALDRRSSCSQRRSGAWSTCCCSVRLCFIGLPRQSDPVSHF